MKKILALMICLFMSIDVVNAEVKKNGGKVTFIGHVVNSECYVSSNTQRVIPLRTSQSKNETPFKIDFTGCNEGQIPNASFSIYDVNASKDTKYVSTYLKNEEIASPNVALELLDEKAQTLDISGKKYLLASKEVSKDLSLNFSARYVEKTSNKKPENLYSVIVFAINYH